MRSEPNRRSNQPSRIATDATNQSVTRASTSPPAAPSLFTWLYLLPLRTCPPPGPAWDPEAENRIDPNHTPPPIILEPAPLPDEKPPERIPDDEIGRSDLYQAWSARAQKVVLQTTETEPFDDSPAGISTQWDSYVATIAVDLYDGAEPNVNEGAVDGEETTSF